MKASARYREFCARPPGAVFDFCFDTILLFSLVPFMMAIGNHDNQSDQFNSHFFTPNRSETHGYAVWFGPAGYDVALSSEPRYLAWLGEARQLAAAPTATPEPVVTPTSTPTPPAVRERRRRTPERVVATPIATPVVTVTATGLAPTRGAADDEAYSVGARTVVFPRDRELKLDVKLTKLPIRKEGPRSYRYRVT